MEHREPVQPDGYEAMDDDTGDQAVHDMSPTAEQLTAAKQAQAGLGRVFWSRLWRLLGIACPSWCTRTVLYTCISLTCALISSASLLLIPQLVGTLFCETTCTCKWQEPGTRVPDWTVMTTLVIEAAVMLVSWLSYVSLVGLLDSLAIWLGWIVGLRWRDSLVQHIHKPYFRNKMYYRIVNLDDRIDNPDQRIAADVALLTENFVTLVFGPQGIFTTFANIVVLTYMAGQTAGWVGIVVPYAWCLIGLAIQKILMGPIVRLTYRQEEMEGDFRYTHVRVRTYAECIAFYNGDKKELGSAASALKALIDNQRALFNRTFFVQLNANFQINMTSLIGYLIPGIAVVLAGSCTYSTDQFTALQQVVLMLMAKLSYLPSLAPKFALIAGVVARVGYLQEVIESIEAAQARVQEGDKSGTGEGKRKGTHHHANDQQGELTAGLLGGVRRRSSSGSWASPETADIQLASVPLVTPDGKQLATRPISFTVHPGDSLVITGPSGCGKSSLLRIIGGLWPVQFGGHVTRPRRIGRGGVLFLPQRPYIVLGDLRTQVIYPHERISHMYGGDLAGTIAHLRKSFGDASDGRSFSSAGGGHGTVTDTVRRVHPQLAGLPEPDYQDSEDPRSSAPAATDLLLTDILRLVRLDYLLDRFDWDSVVPWEDVLSVGEQQRLAFARLLYHRPVFAIMDEATSALDVPTEALCLRACLALGIACISVAHRPTVFPFHMHNLRLSYNGDWELRPITDDEDKPHSDAES